MTKVQLLFAPLAAVVLVPATSLASPRVGVGIGLNFGVPAYYPRPYYYGPRYYYPPPPVVYTPAPVYVQPAPIYVQQPAPVYVQPAASSPAPGAPAPNLPPPTPSVQQAYHQGDPARCEQLLGQLSDSQETTRRDAAMELGRMKAQTALEPLTRMLSTDSSPVVREAAARALGLIGSARALSALIYSAQADQDRDVRSSAQFAIEVIRANLRN